MIKESAFLIGWQPPGQAPPKAIRFRDSLVVMLALTTGSVDAASYLRHPSGGRSDLHATRSSEAQARWWLAACP